MPPSKAAGYTVHRGPAAVHVHVEFQPALLLTVNVGKGEFLSLGGVEQKKTLRLRSSAVRPARTTMSLHVEHIALNERSVWSSIGRGKSSAVVVEQAADAANDGSGNLSKLQLASPARSRHAKLTVCLVDGSGDNDVTHSDCGRMLGEEPGRHGGGVETSWENREVVEAEELNDLKTLFESGPPSSRSIDSLCSASSARNRVCSPRSEPRHRTRVRTVPLPTISSPSRRNSSLPAFRRAWRLAGTNIRPAGKPIRGGPLHPTETSILKVGLMSLAEAAIVETSPDVKRKRPPALW